MHAVEPIACGIGIALGNLTGFYPESGTKEYDLYGQGLILATRYEGLRKTLSEGEQHRSIIILQEIVFSGLRPELRESFVKVDLRERGLHVRDDPAAASVYFKYLAAGHKFKPKMA